MSAPQFLSQFTAQPALETPQVYLAWEFDSNLFADILGFKLVRRADRWPLDESDGDTLLTWASTQPVINHYADTDVAADLVYFYSMFITYGKNPQSAVLSGKTPAVFAEHWTGLVKDVAFADSVPVRTAVAVLNDAGESEVLLLNPATGFVEIRIPLKDLLNTGEEIRTLAHAGPLDGIDTLVFTTSAQRLIRAIYSPDGGQVAPVPGFPVNLRSTIDPAVSIVGSTIEFPASYGLAPAFISLLDETVYDTAPTKQVYKLNPVTGGLVSIVDISGMPLSDNLRGLTFDTLNQNYFLFSGRTGQSYPAASLAPVASLLDVSLYEQPDGVAFALSPSTSILSIQVDGYLTQWDSIGAIPIDVLTTPWWLFRVESMSGCDEEDGFNFRDELYQFISDRMRRVDFDPLLPGPSDVVITLGPAALTYSGRVVDVPVVPGSVQFYDSGVPFVINDNLNGTLSGSNGDGIFDYENGEYSVTFYSMPTGPVYVKFKKAITSVRGEVTLRGMDEPLKHLERFCRFIGLLLDQQTCNRDFLHVLKDRDRAPSGVLSNMAFLLGIPDLNPNWNVDRQRIYLELYPEVLRIRGTLNSFKLLLKFYGYLLDFKDSQIIAARQFLDSVQADPPGLEFDYPTIFDTSAGLFVVNFKLKFRRISDLEVLPAPDPTTQFLLRELEQIKPFNAILEYDPDF